MFAGFELSFAIVVMPGIRMLGFLDFLKCFKAIDGIIQNNQLQSLDLDAATEFELQATAEMFESGWLRWNAIRTVIAMLTTVLLLVLLLRL